MIEALSSSQISSAEDVYERLRVTLETKYPGQYVAIEPYSKEYFVAPRLADALISAKQKLPGKQFYTMRIGHRSAISFS